MLIIDSLTQMGVILFSSRGPGPRGGTIEATGGGTVEIASTVANGPPSTRFDRESFGTVVVGEYSVVIIASGGDVAVPVVIETGGILEYSAGGEVTGSITFEGSDAEFEFGQSNVQSGEISGYRSDDTIAVNGFDIDYQPADPHEALPTAFTLSLAGDVLTQTNADGSTHVTSYDITGQSFTQKAIDTNADGEVVAKYFSGVKGEGDLSAFEYLYAGNNLVGTNEWYSNITGQAYTNEEVDYNGAGEVTRLAFSGALRGRRIRPTNTTMSAASSPARSSPTRTVVSGGALIVLRSRLRPQQHIHRREILLHRRHGPVLHRRGGGLRRERATVARCADGVRGSGLFVA